MRRDWTSVRPSVCPLFWPVLLTLMRSRELSGAYIQSRSPDGGSGQRLTLRSEGRGVEDRRRLVSTALRPTRYDVALMAVVQIFLSNHDFSSVTYRTSMNVGAI